MKRSVFLLATLVACGCASAPSRRAAAPAPERAPAGDPVEQGVALYQQGRYAEAAATLASTSGVRALAYLAASRVRLKQYAQAEAAALKALEASPAHAVASAALGEALVAQGKLDEAIRRLSTVIQLAPRLPYAHYWRGQAYQRKRQVARMADDYRAFLRLAPEAPEAPAVRTLLGSL